ncbi:cytochrome P450 [Umezawaea sp. Da 62-37]|uniref:cytochrome P450 n=1 Tax=Umezawaea sp. Da 62-37 TaxID=3075927 RepID=UPI0028F6CFC6|nr:cytochrome P450 [Umezawaea sp. Da 62-37]WNV85019.1 cytochrome P450 [Umezawaea sp. Da 62-37]
MNDNLPPLTGVLRPQPPHPLPALYTEEFAADPHTVYTELRRHGPAAPVEIAPGVPAMLVTGYRAALRVLQDPATFRKDPRPWQDTLPAGCPITPVVQWRKNALFADGADHARLRAAVSTSLLGVDLMVLRTQVVRIADTLIAGFAASGHADLLHDYAKPLALAVFTRLFGCPQALGEQLMVDTQAIFDGTDPAHANTRLTRTLSHLIDLKGRRPGHDVVTRLMQHPAHLSGQELEANLLVMMGAGSEPEANLIGNTVYRLLTGAAVAGDLAEGTTSVDDALDDVLWSDPSMSNYSLVFPVRDVDLDGIVLPAGQPVLISFAAANTDPALPPEHRNRAHLAFSAGNHACPAQQMARLIASAAIDTLLDRLPGVRLDPDTGPPRWRAAPFTRGLHDLPAVFPPPVRTPALSTSGVAS